MCNRLNRLFPDQKILYTNKAIIIHKHRTSLWRFIKQIYFRSENTLKCYILDKKIPPVYPFPIMTLLISLFFSLFNLWLGLISLIILPQIFYIWWLFKLIKHRNYIYLVLFPYIQLSLELATILGMLRGYIKIKQKL
jgi:hypothetical protein